MMYLLAQSDVVITGVHASDGTTVVTPGEMLTAIYNVMWIQASLLFVIAFVLVAREARSWGGGSNV